MYEPPSKPSLRPVSTPSLTPRFLDRAHEIVAIGTYEICPVSRVIRISAEMAQLLRLGDAPVEMPLEEYRGRFYHPEDRAPSQAEAERRYAAGEPLLIEARAVRADGAVIWARASSSLERDDDGRPVIVGVFQDITRQREAEDAVRASELRVLDTEALFRATFEHAVIGVGLTTTDMRFIRVNQALCKILGYTAEELTCLRVDDVTHPEDRRLGTEFVASAMAGGPDRHGFDKRYVRKDGRVVWVRVSGALVTPAGGQERFCIAHIEDISERKAAELERARMLRDLARLNRIHVMLSAINQTILRAATLQEVLDAACRIAVQKGGFISAWIGLVGEDGRTLKPVAWEGPGGEHLAVLTIDLEGDRARGDPIATGVLAHRHVVCDVATDPAFEAWRAKALARGYRSTAVFPILVRGRLAGYFKMFSGEPSFFDAGELAVLDELADNVGFALESHRREQERRLLEEQLRQTQKLEAIGQLAGGLAHDFNNMISAILAYTAIAMEDLPADAPWRADMREVQRAGQRAAALTRRLLAFGRQQVLVPKRVELGAVLVGMEHMLRTLVGDGVSTVIAPSSGGGTVFIDESQLEQVVMNLAVNARDAMPEGGTLTIQTRRIDLGDERPREWQAATPGPYMLLTIADTGTGIAPATLQHVFEPFFTTKEPGKGTGLGLATVFGIVTQSGGHIAVDTEVGRGTTFKVLLPRTDDPAGQEHVSSVPAPATLRGTETILLVEDDEQVRNVTRTVLQRRGYTVLEGQNAGEALLVSESHAGPIHLLLTDVVMPRLSGWRLAERLTASRPELRVLLFSGYAQPHDAERSAAHRALPLLQKPSTPEELLKKVREVLSSPRPAKP
jgi:PAS domain S-box-containing protein